MIKKKLIYSLLGSALIFQTLTPVFAGAETLTPREASQVHELVKKERSVDVKKKGKATVDPSLAPKRLGQQGLQVQFMNGNSPKLLSGKLSDKRYRNEAEILSFLDEKKSMLKLKEPKKELSLKRKTLDKKNNAHYRFQQKYENIPIYGAEVIVHSDREGKVYAYNSGYQQPDRIRIQTKPGISGDRAVQSAISHLKEAEKIDLSANSKLAKDAAKSLLIFPYKNQYFLAYQIELSFKQPKPGRWVMFVDAHSGKVIHSFNAIAEGGSVTGTGVGYFGDTRTFPAFYDDINYLLKDTTRGQAVIDTIDNQTSKNVSDPDGYFSDENQKTAVDAHYYGGMVYDYFFKHFQRQSYDNQNSPLHMSVHVNYEDGEPMNNAYWDGTGLFFGDGDGFVFSPLSSQLDVVAHEFTHGVTEHSAGLEYFGQSGALNESMSDIFAAIIEGNWLIGEDVYTPFIEGDALRSMEDPTLYGQPSHMNDYEYTYGDNGGVHENSGIPNRAAYVLATTLEQEGIDGKARLGEMAYWALTNYLFPTSNFNDARDGFLLAAATLYGPSSKEYTAVDEAWKSVGVPFEETPVELDDPYEDNNTFEQAAPIEWGKYKPYLSTDEDVDWFKLNVAEEGQMAISFGDFEYYGPYTMEIYDENMEPINQVYSNYLESDEELLEYGAFLRQQVSPGTYYIKVYSEYGVTGQTSYLFTVSQDTFEPNDTFSEAASIQIGDSIQSYLTYMEDTDLYQFTVSDNKKVQIRLSELPGDYDLYLYNADDPDAWIASSENYQNVNEEIAIALTPGTYYVEVYPAGMAAPFNPYRLTLNEGAVVPYDAQFTWYPEYMTAGKGKRFEVLLDLLNSGDQAWDSGQFKVGIAEGSDWLGEDTGYDWPFPTSFGETWYTSIYLQAPNEVGDYIVPLQMYQLDGNGQKVYFGQKVEVQVKVVDDPLEPNNSYWEATPIISGQSVQSKVSSWADDDYYTFQVDEVQDVTIDLSGMGADYDLYLNNDNWDQVAESVNRGLDDEKITVHLYPGTYYIVVWAYDFTETGDQSYQLLFNAQTSISDRGDFDHDGDRDSDDLDILQESYGETDVIEKDMNQQGDSTGIVDVFDIISWIKKYNP